MPSAKRELHDFEFFRAGQLPAVVSWHFLFRRNLYPDPPEDSHCREEVAEIRNAFQTFEQEIGERKVFFYTDSTELTQQYEQLGTFPFHTLSIPHTYSPRDALAHEGPLRVTYLGDARREKGYHLLPKIVGDLRQDGLAGKLHFVVQSNYNVPGGEPEAVVARGQLDSFLGSMVSLYKQALCTADYKALLLSSDITILPYDRTSYSARSSGILVESLAAGIPVIVPAGTWLSRQLLTVGYADRQERPRKKWGGPSVKNGREMTVVESFGQSSLSWCCHGTPDVSAFVDGKLEAGLESKVREIADHYPHYRRTAAEFAKQWRSFHNADRLVADIAQNAGSGYGPAAEVSDAAGADGSSITEQDIACA